MDTVWGFRLAAEIAPHLPRALGYWLAERLGDHYFARQEEARGALVENLAFVLPQAGLEERLQLARQAFRNQVKNYFDLFALPRLSLGRVARLVRVDGLERLRAAVRRDRGAVVAGPHLGNVDVVAQAAVAHGLAATLAMERLHPAELFQLARRLRASQGIQVVGVDTAGLRAVVRSLRGGSLVGMTTDRDSSGSGRWLSFFGHPAKLPVGYVALALRTGAPLFLAFAERLPRERYGVEVVGPLPLVRTEDPEEAIEINVREPLRLMEDRIRRRPGQWVMFERVWSPSGQRPAGRAA